MSLPIEKTGDQQVEHLAHVMSNDNVDSKDADVRQAQELADQFANGTSQAEKDLVRKLDWRILPCCWILYLLGFLDRANVGYVGHLTLSIKDEYYADN
jgi:hypothetical protein